MDTLLAILALLLSLVGIVGCIIPILPGVALAYAGLVCCRFCSFSTISATTMWIYLALTAAAMVMDYLLPAYMARLAGGSSAGVRGATAGMLLGMLTGNIIVMIIGPFLGAVAGEMVCGTTLDRALKVGFGSFLSFVTGTGVKLTISVLMLVRVVREIYGAASVLF